MATQKKVATTSKTATSAKKAPAKAAPVKKAAGSEGKEKKTTSVAVKAKAVASNKKAGTAKVAATAGKSSKTVASKTASVATSAKAVKASAGKVATKGLPAKENVSKVVAAKKVAAGTVKGKKPALSKAKATISTSAKATPKKEAAKKAGTKTEAAKSDKNNANIATKATKPPSKIVTNTVAEKSGKGSTKKKVVEEKQLGNIANAPKATTSNPKGKVDTEEDAKPIKSEAVAKKKAEEKVSTTKAATKKAESKPLKVVIPKTSTSSSVKYEPAFTRSVLDQPEAVETGPTMRYSDMDLVEFRDLINKKLDAAKKELTYLQGLITRKDEMGGDNDDARYMTMEDGSMSMEREQLSQMASRQIQFIDHLDKALMRIENKTYGICRVSGKLIDKARLRAVPHATLSMEAKLGLVK